MSFEAILAKNNLPPATGEVIDMRWMASTGDWWHRTAAGWFWFDARTKAWKSAPLGP